MKNMKILGGTQDTMNTTENTVCVKLVSMTSQDFSGGRGKALTTIKLRPTKTSIFALKLQYFELSSLLQCIH